MVMHLNYTSKVFYINHYFKIIHYLFILVIIMSMDIKASIITIILMYLDNLKIIIN